MEEDKAHRPWSELNEVSVLAALCADSNSEYWITCYEFVRFLLGKHYPQFQPQVKEEIVQDILLLVHKNLATFRGQSQFKTWLTSITRNRAIDILRQPKNARQLEVSMDELPDIHMDVCTHSFPVAPKNPEALLLIQEHLHEVKLALEEFISMHRKMSRNRQILQRVLYDGYSQEEVAQTLGIPAPVVGHVVRSARDYIRQKLSEQGT
jgi:RNA polymerase sigma factor (sigma-70 family)